MGAGRGAVGATSGRDERRMQVRAYNHWAGLLGQCDLPAIASLDPAGVREFGPSSVLLDLTESRTDPAVRFLGECLAEGCGDGAIRSLADVPERTLLAQLAERCGAMLASRAPLGFESQFVDAGGRTILCRGILLPFSSERDSVDYIYGVVSWKEGGAEPELPAAAPTAAETVPGAGIGGDRPVRREPPLTTWADGPLAGSRPPSGSPSVRADAMQRLRDLPPRSLAEVAADGSEFALLVVRRLPAGEVALLGELSGDDPLLETAVARLLG